MLTPDHIIELLGLTVNFIDMELQLPPTRIKHIQAESEDGGANTLAHLGGTVSSQSDKGYGVWKETYTSQLNTSDLPGSQNTSG